MSLSFTLALVGYSTPVQGLHVGYYCTCTYTGCTKNPGHTLKCYIPLLIFGMERKLKNIAIKCAYSTIKSRKNILPAFTQLLACYGDRSGGPLCMPRPRMQSCDLEVKLSNFGELETSLRRSRTQSRLLGVRGVKVLVLARH